MSLVNPDKYFREKLNRLSMRDYTDLMKRYVRKEGVEMREFDKAIDELLGDKEDTTMTDKNELLKIANLTKEKLKLEAEFEKLKKEVNSEEGFNRVVYTLPTQNFVAIRDNKTGDWVTTDDCRFVFKREYTNNIQQSLMLPVGIINLETKEVVIFNLGDKKIREEKDMANSRLVTPFYPGFYIFKDESNNTYPTIPVNVNVKNIWNLYDEDNRFTYELITASNPEQIQEIGQRCDIDGKVKSVIGYIPFIIGVKNFNDFEFYQAYN